MVESVPTLILGTAGHIDHGKTALVRALTGVETDRLEEERRRGITIDLGFARFAPEGGRSFGVVDVPGHEGFIRNMLAGATGMDVVLLVVAADEGVMPQTREHLAIVRLLRIPRLVVALTKVDLVEGEWLELVEDDVRELLADTSYADATMVHTSVVDGTGIAELSDALAQAAGPEEGRLVEDTARLPVDRVFTVEGAGTVVTGTLWSGSLAVGSTVRLLPVDEEARIRRLQVHGEDVEVARAGQRTAVALTGNAVRRGLVERGHVVVDLPAWSASRMLTVDLELLDGTGWVIQSGQRVRIHLGTAEVMARVVLFPESGGTAVLGQGAMLGQLRLESPLVARAGDRFVVRSYSPMTTIAGGTVLEPNAPKRKSLSAGTREALKALVDGGEGAAAGVLALAGWAGLPADEVAVRIPRGVVVDGEGVDLNGVWFAESVVDGGEARLLEAADAYHQAHPLHAGAPLEQLRGTLPPGAHPDLVDHLIRRLVAREALVVQGAHARRPDFRPTFTTAQAALRDRIADAYRAAGLQPPGRGELPDSVREARDFEAVLQFMIDEGDLTTLGEEFVVWTASLDEASKAVQDQLGGREGLGPAEFREVLPVTRRHLIPLLAHLDARGVTIRRDGQRDVPAPS